MPSARRMIFTCGVRFMRPRSATDSGRLSRSALAAASTCFGVIGRSGRLVVFGEVVILLSLGCLARRDDPDAAVPFGIADGEQRAFRNANQNETVLAVVLAVVQPLDGEWVLEHQACHFETHAMLGVVLGGLGFV